MSPILRNILAVLLGAVACIFLNGILLNAMMKLVGTPVGFDPNDAGTYGLLEGRHFLSPFIAHAVPSLVGGAIAAAGAEIGGMIGVRYLCTFTQTGESARRMAQIRHNIPVLAFTPLQATRSQLSLTWGVETFLTETPRHTDDYAKTIDRILLEAGRLEVGERVIIIAGSPPGIPGSTNALRVHRGGDAVSGLIPAYSS